MYKIYIFLSVISFPSCLPTINYLGNSYAATKDPDLFVDENSIERPYKIIGKGYPERFGSLALESLQRKAIKKARDKGADALLIQDYYFVNMIASPNSIYRDTSGRGLITTGNSVIVHGDYDCTRFVILFLKYTDH